MLLIRLSILFLLLFSLPGYGQDKVRKRDINQYDEYDKKQGLWRYYSGGILISEINYVNDKRHGVSTKYYSSSGAMMEMMNYEDGVRDGEYKRYFYNGNLALEGEFLNGKKHGKWIKYNLTTGEVKSEGSYTKNKKDGEWKFFNSKNELVSYYTYKDGVLISENGQPIVDQKAKAKAEADQKKLQGKDKVIVPKGTGEPKP